MKKKDMSRAFRIIWIDRTWKIQREYPIKNILIRSAIFAIYFLEIFRATKSKSEFGSFDLRKLKMVGQFLYRIIPPTYIL